MILFHVSLTTVGAKEGATSRWLSKERLVGLGRMENGVEKDYILGDDGGWRREKFVCVVGR